MSQAVMDTHHTRIHFPFYLRLTVPAAIGTLIAALAGVINPHVYGNSESLAAQGQGQDLVTLAFVLPVLLLSAWYAAHDSIRGRIIWQRAMIYIAYTYAIAAFQVEFNALFLVYVITLGSAFYGLTLGFMSFRAETVHLDVKAPIRALSLIAGFIAIAYYAIWLNDVLPAVLNNTVPQAVITDNVPTSGVHVLDMGFYLPLLLAGAVLLWQRKPLGFVLTGSALAFGPLMGVAVIAMIINSANWGLVDSIAPAVMFAITALLTGGTLVWLLRYIHPVHPSG